MSIQNLECSTYIPMLAYFLVLVAQTHLRDWYLCCSKSREDNFLVTVNNSFRRFCPSSILQKQEDPTIEVTTHICIEVLKNISCCVAMPTETTIVVYSFFTQHHNSH